MNISTEVTLPYFVYSIYADAAQKLGNVSIEDVLAAGLTAYAKYLLDEMIKNGEITLDQNKQFQKEFGNIL